MEFRQLKPTTIPGDTSTLIFAQKYGAETYDSLRLSSNFLPGTEGGAAIGGLVDSTKNGWVMTMGGALEGWSLLRRSTTDTIAHIMAVIGPPVGGQSAGQLALYADTAGETSAINMGYNGNAPIKSFAVDTSGNPLLGSTVGTHTIDQTDFFFAGGTTSTNGGVVHKTKAGVPTDADCTNPQSGQMIIDTTDSKIYVRVGSTWKSVAVA